uniref:Uncharacterized protein n=1 Tax=Amphimedon queenslandica TaxID=400682 RepID=A0A1X7TDF0_AMPQE
VFRLSFGTVQSSKVFLVPWQQ